MAARSDPESPLSDYPSQPVDNSHSSSTHSTAMETRRRTDIAYALPPQLGAEPPDHSNN